MTDPIDGYIRENRDKYTREAIREQLIAGGHDPVVIEEAWIRLEAERREPAASGWRVPGWLFAVLVVGGGIGAAAIWAGEPYPRGAGGIAAVVYIIAAVLALLVSSKWIK